MCYTALSVTKERTLLEACIEFEIQKYSTVFAEFNIRYSQVQCLW